MSTYICTFESNKSSVLIVRYDHKRIFFFHFFRTKRIEHLISRSQSYYLIKKKQTNSKDQFNSSFS